MIELIKEMIEEIKIDPIGSLLVPVGTSVLVYTILSLLSRIL